MFIEATGPVVFGNSGLVVVETTWQVFIYDTWLEGFENTPRMLLITLVWLLLKTLGRVL